MEADDFELPSNSSEAAYVKDFTHVWKTDSNCNSTSKESIPNACKLELDYYQETQQICKKLKKAPFDVCGPTVDVSLYRLSCIENRCARISQGAECWIFAAYALECANNGISIEWRNENLCREYPNMGLEF